MEPAAILPDMNPEPRSLGMPSSAPMTSAADIAVLAVCFIAEDPGTRHVRSSASVISANSFSSIVAAAAVRRARQCRALEIKHGEIRFLARREVANLVIEVQRLRGAQRRQVERAHCRQRMFLVVEHLVSFARRRE